MGWPTAPSRCREGERPSRHGWVCTSSGSVKSHRQPVPAHRRMELIRLATVPTRLLLNLPRRRPALRQPRHPRGTPLPDAPRSGRTSTCGAPVCGATRRTASAGAPISAASPGEGPDTPPPAARTSWRPVRAAASLDRGTDRRRCLVALRPGGVRMVPAPVSKAGPDRPRLNRRQVIPYRASRHR